MIWFTTAIAITASLALGLSHLRCWKLENELCLLKARMHRLGMIPDCDICGRMAEGGICGPGVIGGELYLCRECFRESQELLEADNEC